MIRITPTPTAEEAAAIVAAWHLISQRQKPSAVAPPAVPSRWPQGMPSADAPDRSPAWGSWWR